MRSLGRAALFALFTSTACGTPPPPLASEAAPTTSADESPSAAEIPSVRASASSASTTKRAPIRSDEEDAELRRWVDAVSRARALPRKKPVLVTTLGRDELLEKTKKKLREELPPEVLTLQGETLRSVGLIPADYDLEAGLLKLVQARVAGFYDPDDATMFLLDDLSPEQVDETLSHELVHALQDQSFSIGPMLEYREGESDRASALQMLVEGDATSLGFDLAHGNAFSINADSLEAALELSTSLSAVGAQTPPMLVQSLIAPYSDGFRFVQALRSHGGWAGVDKAFREPPASTEQILHPEKYFAKERPVNVAPLLSKTLGSGFQVKMSDQNGELGLRLMLQQWVDRGEAYKAAAGWGGDRFTVWQATTDGVTSTAVAFFTRMDTNPDAVELATALHRKFGKGCHERSDFGPLLIGERHRDVLIIAGPYQRDAAGRHTASGTCAQSKKWAQEIFGAVAR